MSMDVSAIRALQADLGRRPLVAVGLARQATRKAGLDVEREAKVRAPVATGFMQGSIGTDVVGNEHVTTVKIGPTAEYAPYVEYGTHRAAAQPFMGPAVDLVAPGFEAAIRAIGEMPL